MTTTDCKGDDLLDATVWQPRWEAAKPAYDRKIRTYARQHFTSIPGFGQDDLESELLEVLWRCVQNYDPHSGATFNTFFWQAVHNRYTDLIKAAFRKKRQSDIGCVSLDVAAVREAVEERVGKMIAVPSPEDYLMALSTVQERFRNLSRQRQDRIVEDLS